MHRRSTKRARVTTTVALFTGMVAAGCLLGGGAAFAGTSVSCDTSSSVITCNLPTSDDANSVDVADLVSQLSSDGVTSGTPIWIQAWGGHGGHGAGYNVQASGGLGGYAQSVTTLGDLESDYGVSTLYYYVGDDGNSHGSDTDDTEGGDGGASTVVSTADLSSATPSINVGDPTSGNVLLLAGGGGGGAGESPNIDSIGDTGGAGGVAVASTSSSKTTDGGDAVEKNGTVNGEGGKGGECPNGGEKGTSNNGDGDDGSSGVGGEGAGGGQQSSGHFGSVGWVNIDSVKLSDAGGGGAGAAGSYNDSHLADNGAGGGGGGGYGGGGGGAAAYTSDPGGGGGGCSFAAESLDSDILAPTGYQSNPGSGQGAVQLSFDTVNSTATFEVPTPAKAGDSGSFTAHYKVSTTSGSKTFYAAGGTLSGAWNGSTDTLSSGSGSIDLESSSGNALTQTVAIDEGASITPETNTECSSGESQYALDGQIEVTDVPVFGSVSGDADLTGCGSITGTVTYNGSLSNLSPSDITSASVDDLELQMEPVTTLDAPEVESVESPMYAEVGCADQACRIRVGGKVKVKGHHGHAFSRPLATKHVHVVKSGSKRVHLRFKWRHHSAVRRLARDLGHRDRARLKIRVRAKGSRGAVGHSRLSVKLRR